MPALTSSLHTWLFNRLINNFKWRKVPVLKSIWFSLWAWSGRQYRGLVRTRMYGYPALVPNGSTYPRLVNAYPRFNQPILAAVWAATQMHDRPVSYADVGTGMGDTPLMILRRFGPQISQVVCVDGDAGFVETLHLNLAPDIHRVSIVHTLLSDKAEDIPELVVEHNSTANASGKNKVPALSFDQALTQTSLQKLDVLKVDVDGYDGKVLTGAAGTLAAGRPVVVFEWNPALYRLCGNDDLEPFRALMAAGYDRLIWWGNVGTFSHFTRLSDQQAWHELADYCTSNYNRDGYHFDILALHHSHPITPLQIVEWAAAGASDEGV